MKKTYRSLVVPLTVAATLLTSVSPSFADLPPLIPRQILFGNPEKASPQISPDGKYLTYIAPDKNNVLQVWIRSVGKQDDRILTANKKDDIYKYFWTYNGQQLIYQQDADGDENWHFYAVDIKSNNVRDLTPYKGIQAEMIALDPKFPNQALIGMNLKDFRKVDAYRIDLKSGKSQLDTQNPGNIIDFKADPKFQIRAGLATTPDGGWEILTKEYTNKSWKTIRKLKPDVLADLISFSQDGKTLYIQNNHNANAVRLKALNLATGKETVLAQDPQYDVGDYTRNDTSDVGNLLVHPVKRQIQAVGFYRDKLEWQVLDKSIADDFAAIAKVRRGEFSIVGRDLADKTWLVKYTTDDEPVYYYTYDRRSKKSQFLFSNRPELEKFSLAQKKPIAYQSRDGLTIHGYLTTPVGIETKNLPTVLLVHGGPGARDTWGYTNSLCI